MGQLKAWIRVVAVGALLLIGARHGYAEEDIQAELNRYLGRIYQHYELLKQYCPSDSRCNSVSISVLSDMESLLSFLYNLEMRLRSKLLADPNYRIPQLSLNLPFVGEQQALRQQIESGVSQAMALMRKYKMLSDVISQADIDYINNVAKMVLKITISRIKAPELSDLDFSGELSDVKAMKSFIRDYKAIHARRRQIYQQWRAIMDEIRPAVDAYNSFTLLAKKQKRIIRMWRKIRERLSKVRKDVRNPGPENNYSEVDSLRIKPDLVFPDGIDKEQLKRDIRDRITDLYLRCRAEYDEIIRENKRHYVLPLDDPTALHGGAALEGQEANNLDSLPISLLYSEAKLQVRRPEPAKNFKKIYLRVAKLRNTVFSRLVPLLAKYKGLGCSYPEAEKLAAKVDLAYRLVNNYDKILEQRYKDMLKYHWAMVQAYSKRKEKVVAFIANWQSRYVSAMRAVLKARDDLNELVEANGQLTLPYSYKAIDHLREKVKAYYKKGDPESAIRLISNVLTDWQGFLPQVASFQESLEEAQNLINKARSYLSESDELELISDYKQLAKRKAVRDVGNTSGRKLSMMEKSLRKKLDRHLYFASTSGIAGAIFQLKQVLGLLKALNYLDKAIYQAKLRDDVRSEYMFYKMSSDLLKSNQMLLSKWLPYDPANKSFVFTSRANREFVRRRKGNPKEPSGGDSCNYNWKVLDSRLSDKPINNNGGILTLTKDDLVNGEISVVFQLASTKGLKKILYSIDGGRSWKELRVSKIVRFSFSPVDGGRYILRVRLLGGENCISEQDLFPNIREILYFEDGYMASIFNVLAEIGKAYESEDIAAFMRLVSDDFFGNKSFLREGLRLDFDLFTNIQLKFFIDKVNRYGDKFFVDVRWDKIQIVRKTGKQQRTTGKTQMVFVIGKRGLKLYQLRGNLLFATLSPEIALASGLSADVVNKIRQAKMERNPVQPGAGDVLENGGVEVEDNSSQDSSQKVSSLLAIVTDSITFSLSGPYPIIDFTANSINTGSADFVIEINLFIDDTYLSGIQKVTTAFDDLTEAPKTGYSNSAVFSQGDVFVFKTKEGYFGKVEVSSFSIVGSTINLSLRWAVQRDGSTYIATQ